MKRTLKKLRHHTFDIVIIGGGIYGASVARDAALRGLNVALIEKDDFGAATSANSLRIIHGGLRYLQDGNLKLVRTMTNERATWLRVAPHLVHPRPFLTPTYGHFTRSKLAMGIALAVIDSVGFDRNRGVDTQNRMPGGRILSRAETLERMNWIGPQTTGGAMWYDAQIYDSERLLIALIASAADAGAAVANYVQVNGLLSVKDSIYGVSAVDRLDGQEFKVNTRLVINCSGAWSDQVLGSLENNSPAQTYHLSVAINLVIRKLPLDCAIGVPSKGPVTRNGEQDKPETRMLFITPWQEYAIAGTWHVPCHGCPQDFQVTEDMIQSYIDELNAAYPVLNLRRQDVYQVHCGFLPLESENPDGSTIKLLRENRIVDHSQTDGIDNLITVTGVKYTTARQGAEQAVDLAVNKLGRSPIGCRTTKTAVSGGDFQSFSEYKKTALATRPLEISEESMRHLIHSYGTEHKAVLKITEQEPDLANRVMAGSPVLKAEIVYAVRQEMAQKLTDVVYRRTPLGKVQLPDINSLRVCAELMANEAGWDPIRCEEEIAAVSNQLQSRNSPQSEGWQ